MLPGLKQKEKENNSHHVIQSHVTEHVKSFLEPPKIMTVHTPCILGSVTDGWDWAFADGQYDSSLCKEGYNPNRPGR